MLRQEGRLFSHLVTPAVCLMGNPRGEPASLSRRFAVGIAVPNVKSSVPYLDTHFCEKMCPLSTQIWTGQSIGIQLSNKLGLASNMVEISFVGSSFWFSQDSDVRLGTISCV